MLSIYALIPFAVGNNIYRFNTASFFPPLILENLEKAQILQTVFLESASGMLSITSIRKLGLATLFRLISKKQFSAV